jgi:3-oxoacyl-[acyl-carrier protein] reductase
LVTGGSRGIDRAAALALGKAGAQVLVHYGRADAVAADLVAPDGPHKLAKQVRAIVGDRLDILVASAGISKAATIEETTVANFDELFAVNVRPRSSSCSSYYQSSPKAAASSSSHRLPLMLL